jgi:hypothetical protein
VVLSNVALLAENGQLLLDAKLPEEFLVPHPMRLTQPEMEELATEFPDAQFLNKNPAKDVPPAPAGPLKAAGLRA